MEQAPRSPSHASVPLAEVESAAAWRLLDAVWDVPVGLGLCDASLRFVRVNRALADFDGLPVVAHYEDDALSHLPEALVAGLRNSGSGVPHDIEFISSGRIVLAKLHTIVRPGDRVPIGVGIVAFDITDERKAFRDTEEANRLVAELLAHATAKQLALSRLIESMQEGLLLVDPSGRVKQVNRSAEQLLGRSRQALVGSAFEDERWSGADGSGKRDAAALVSGALGDPSFHHGELHVETSSGPSSLLAGATALRDENGEVEDVVISLRDVTHERRELELARSNLDFQQQIIAIVGHDLRNPLATIAGSIALLRRQAGLTETSVSSLDRMARSAARMARLISDLLDFARTRSPGGLPIVLMRSDLHTICKASVEECRTAHPSSTITLETSGDATGYWDADRIEQALTNLIVNAIQHGAASPIRIQSIATATANVEIRVHNQGAVIPADVLPELFKAYRRGIRGKSIGVPGGLGLGLFIVAQIAASHGGRAYAESSAEDGTTFTIELPRAVPKGRA